MDKKNQIVLAIAVLILFAIVVFGFNSDMFFLGGTVALALIFVLILLINPVKRSSEGKTKTIGVDAEATTDSRICEKITGFMGVPIILVFGGVWSKYESIFSVEYGGENIVVLYQGVCLVSKNDKLRITGEWHKGKKIGIEKNVVIASRVENMSSGIVFDNEK